MLSFEERASLFPGPEERRLETVVPFRPWRYAPTAGELTQLVAPPYDVIGPDLQSRLYARSRHNVVRVDLGMTTPSDNECDDRYTRAAAQLAQWKESGILVRDADPSITFVEESFTGPDGRASIRHGFLALMRLYDFDEGVVFPHEYTLAGPKEDRYRLMTATEMSLSPVFLLYDLPGDEITTAWKAGPGAQAPAATVSGEEGTVIKLWPTSDPALLGDGGAKSGGCPFCHRRRPSSVRDGPALPETPAGRGRRRARRPCRGRRSCRGADAPRRGNPWPPTICWPTSATCPTRGWPSTAPIA